MNRKKMCGNRKQQQLGFTFYRLFDFEQCDNAILTGMLRDWNEVRQTVHNT